MQENRRTQRLSIELPAQYRLADKDVPFQEAIVLNINVKGIYLIIPQKVERGQKMTLRISLPEWGEVILGVKVIWVKKEATQKEYSVGVQIPDVIKDDEAKFVRFYANQLLKIPS